jgi:predicted enzyme related to lactoylglutathione lyase
MLAHMPKITGIGGVFFKTPDREATARWFSEKLDLPTEAWGRLFLWREHDDPDKSAYTVLGLHETASTYYEPSTLPFMLNLRVDDLDGMLARLEARGVEVVKRFDTEPNGRFAHVMGPGGIKLELWEPAADEPAEP